ncbi:2-oxo-hept-4-ene-1,7-dioate hydratase [Novosphingobium mangrovi (ex Huang et al. 2023)]|uniref:2-oxo-hepta-3-ene-1,7-dioic acid hydratase n=1 Tax=Novosphingobium mangrovi (ex Huang et al. 2023) TaxID=2976432 RepID=A0ABT2IA51_9SPHN|nr:2-oxo-hepta-3-ene-1,7-dioic acid hydratase [Novosphingobium mangrovi (ex Huang et al. 2023)]MCT2401443.1 2-oxo-hepta-3-ene-1,7-dioic acid hydratase [Novosphingobium mangrovi (ex Huang et al. 2023)]
MALSPKIIDELAARLDVAEKTRTQVGQFSLEHPEMTLEDGYAVSRAWVRHKLAEGRSVIGHKIGLTSRAMQRSSNVDEPDFGTLLDDMLFLDGHDIPMDRFIEPRVEVELAFILKQPLKGPGCTLYDVLNATDYVTPAIEIIDARIERIDKATGKTRKVFDTISDNAANAGIVLGGRPVKPDAVDLRWVSALLYRNGVIEESGVAAAVLNHPANGPAWLANKIAPHGEQLEPGQIVLGGSFTAPVFARAGDSFHVDYGPLGSISVRFV